MREYSKFGLLLICLSLFSVSATWPWDAYTAKENAPAAEDETKAPAMVSSRTNLTAAKAQEQASANTPIDLSRSSYAPPVLKPSNAAARYENPAMNLPGTKSIQQNVEQLITLNDNLKKLHAENASQIKGMIDQARVHQRLLDVDNIDTVKLPGKVTVKDLNKVLMQEKIRQVRDQTKQNIQAVRDIREFQAALADEKQKASKPTAG